MSIFNFADERNISPAFDGVVEAPTQNFADVVPKAFDDFLARRITGAKTFGIQQETVERDKSYYDLNKTDIYGDAINKYLKDDESIFRQLSGTIQKDNPKVQDAVDRYVTDLKLEDPERYKDIKTRQELEASSIEKRKKAVETYEKTMAGATPAVGMIGSIVGGVGASFFDPVNLASMAFGAGPAAGILKTMAVEAGINIAAEALTLPSQIKASEELGFELTTKDIVTDLLTAGAFGAGLSGSVKGLSLGIERIQGKRQAIINQLQDAGDFDGATAMKALEIQQHVDSFNLSDVIGFEPAPLLGSLDDGAARGIRSGQTIASPKSKAELEVDVKENKMLELGRIESLKKLRQTIDDLTFKKEKQIQDLETNVRNTIAKLDQAGQIDDPELVKNLPRKQKKQAQAKLTDKQKAKIVSELQAEFEEQVFAINRAFEAETRIFKQEQIDIEERNNARFKNYQDRTKEIQGIGDKPYNFMNDFNEAQQALRQRRKINPEKITLTEAMIRNIDVDTVKHPYLRQNISEFQQLIKSTDGAIDEALPQVKSLDEPMFRDDSIKDKQVESQEQISKIQNSQRYIDDEESLLNELADNEIIFKDGEVKKSGQYEATEVETIGSIKNELNEVKALREAMKTCGLG